MNRRQLVEQIKAKKSYLCIGLDADITKIPSHLLGEKDPVFAFNKAIIDATKDYGVSYKINTAFYESRGSKGWETLEKTAHYIPGEIFKIADAKRGDIGNTSTQYAKAFFENMPFDAITVAPYMGADSVKPFLEHTDKWTILLALTSNAGAQDFELQMTGSDYLFEHVMKTSMSWGNTNNLMYVVGATQSKWFSRARTITPDHFYLVPGVGAQGGSLNDISQHTMNKDVGLLVNISRAIIYASAGEDFSQKAQFAAMQYQQEMSGYMIDTPVHKDKVS